jgi:hypothetical protein
MSTVNSNIARVISSAANWDSAYAWGNHALAGYATGTPLYVESDPAWHSGTGALWSAIGAASNTNAVTAVIVNGVTNTPTNGVVDLGTITGGDTNAITAVIVNGVTNTPTAGVVDLGETTDPYAVTRIFVNGVANYPVFGSVDLGTITGSDTNAVKKIILNGVTNTPSSGTVTLPTIPTNPVTKIILNGITNTPASGTVNLGTITSDVPVTNVSVYPPNDCVVLTIPTNAFVLSGADNINKEGIYTKVSSTLYTNVATGAHCFYDIDTWVIEFDAESTAYFLETTNESPWLVSSDAGLWGYSSEYMSTPPTLTGYSTNKLASLSDIGTKLSAGISTNFTFLSAMNVTGRVWIASGILTNVDLNIGD